MVRQIDLAVGLINALQHGVIITANLVDEVISILSSLSFLKTSIKMPVWSYLNKNQYIVLIGFTAILLVLLGFKTNFIIWYLS